MKIEKHDLIHEFPEYKEQIHQLKMTDTHFLKLFNQYHEVDHEVHRIEVGAETTSDDYLDSKKKERLHLKDSLYVILKKNA